MKTKFQLADGDGDGVFSGWCSVMRVPAVINHLYCYFPPAPSPDWRSERHRHLSCEVLTSPPSPVRTARARSGLHKRNSSYLLPNIIFLVGHDFNIRSHGRGERCKRKLADFPSVNGDCKIPLRRDLAWLGEDSASDGDSTAGLDNKIVSCEQLAHSAQPSIIMP